MGAQARQLGVVLVAAGLVGLVACSGGGSSGAARAATSPAPAATSGPGAPEEQRTSASAVASGLRKIQDVAGQIAATAGSDKAKATELADQIEPNWMPIEGTVKANDQDAYLAFEDAFTVLEDAAKNGDGAAAGKGSANVSATAQRYLAKYPG